LIFVKHQNEKKERVSAKTPSNAMPIVIGFEQSEEESDISDNIAREAYCLSSQA